MIDDTSRRGCVVRPADIRILLTGASGNLGSAVLPRLIEDGHDVRAGALTTTAQPTGTRAWRDYLAARY